MIVNISSLLIGNDKRIPIDCKVVYNAKQDILKIEKSSSEEVIFIEDSNHENLRLFEADFIEIDLFGNIFCDNGVFIQLEYSASMKIPCSRCLEMTDYIINGNLYDMLCDAKGCPNEEMEALLQRHQFLLQDYLVNDLIINQEAQILCSDECMGLCSQCGINLNNEKCDCESLSIDPRLCALKDFLNDKEV